jgi:hypothetical protein
MLDPEPEPEPAVLAVCGPGLFGPAQAAIRMTNELNRDMAATINQARSLVL